MADSATALVTYSAALTITVNRRRRQQKITATKIESATLIAPPFHRGRRRTVCTSSARPPSVRQIVWPPRAILYYVEPTGIRVGEGAAQQFDIRQLGALFCVGDGQCITSATGAALVRRRSPLGEVDDSPQLGG
jgi:hypothetical protein